MLEHRVGLGVADTAPGQFGESSGSWLSGHSRPPWPLPARPCRWPGLSSEDVSESGNDEMTGDSTPTVRERLRNAQVSDERVRDHFEARAITLDGEIVRDLGQSAPHGSRIVFTAR